MSEVWSESNTFDIWVQIEKAVAEAWCAEGVIQPDELSKIQQATFDIALYEQIFEETRHDIVSFVRALTASLGAEGRWIHYGLTSNDVKDTGQSIQVVQSCEVLERGIREMQDVLRMQAAEYRYTPCAGRSHGMHAEPLSFGLKFALWSTEMERNLDRLRAVKARFSVCKLSGPVGTYATTPPQIERFVAAKFGLSPILIASQVISRDLHAEYLSVLALIGASVEKVATELRHLQRTELAEVQEPFNKKGYVSKGSSSMPHKRNPELSERVCGLARLIRGNAVVASENVALWHERDISHSSAERIILPDSSIALDYILHTMTGVIRDLQVDTERMAANMDLSHGTMFSTRVLQELISAGIDRTEAYNILQKTSAAAVQSGLHLKDVIAKEPAVTAHLSAEQLAEMFDAGWYLRYVDEQLQRIGIG